MTISEHPEEFAGLPVREYDPEEGIQDPLDSAPRLASEYDPPTGRSMESLLSRFLDDPAASQVVALVIGPWEGLYDGQSDSSSLVASLVAAKDRLRSLKALFFGDITYDECEISWINQSDVSPLLAAFPALEHFRVRGGNNLSFGDGLSHDSLRVLVIESGGLDGEVVRTVAAAQLPNLEHLELWLGDEYYGGGATVADLAPILSGEVFPKLKYLGLRDFDGADVLAVALADAPVLRRIEVLDLSLGTLGDEGVVALLQGGALSSLKRLDIHHHYVSDEVLDGLKALGIELNADDQQDADENDGERYVAVGE